MEDIRLNRSILRLPSFITPIRNCWSISHRSRAYPRRSRVADQDEDPGKALKVHVLAPVSGVRRHSSRGQGMAVLHQRIARHQYPRRRRKGEEIIWIHPASCAIYWVHSIRIRTISSQFLKINITIKANKGYKIIIRKLRSNKEDQRVQSPKVHGMFRSKARAMAKLQSQKRGETRSLKPTYLTFLSIPTPQSSHSI